MDMIERVIREATAKSKDGRIDQADFLEYSQSSTRYSLFTPMEASIIFHFAGRGNGTQRLALPDFAQLLDPRWKAPFEAPAAATGVTAEEVPLIHRIGESVYNFAIGGVAGAFGATFVYPIDLGKIPTRFRGLVACANGPVQ
jgi:solute carrier family 25 (mitochondrial aspartate/glutamate transporter), member 12/13